MPDEHRDDGFDPDRWDAKFIVMRDGARELEEGEYRRTLASLNSGWLARGGLLRLHGDRLSFTPTPMERMLFARGHTIAFADVRCVAREPENVQDVLPGGRSARMVIRTDARTFEFVFLNGLDDWLDAVRERLGIWERRLRMGNGNSES